MSLIVLHSKLGNRFTILYDIINYTSYVIEDESVKKSFGDIFFKIQVIELEYNTFTMPIVISYFGKDNNRTKIIRKNDRYLNNIKSMNIINKLNYLFNELYARLSTIIESGSFTEKNFTTKTLADEYKNLNYVSTMRKLLEKYHLNNVVIERNFTNHVFCDACNVIMTICPNTSLLNCNSCGQLRPLAGIIFDYSQMYSNKNSFTKNRQYNSRKHSIKWLDFTQAIDDVPSHVIERIDKCAVSFYTINGTLTDMSNLSCQQVRDWLKLERMTSYNNSAPAIRKAVTGLHGKAQIPPQLSSEERETILNDIVKVLLAFPKVITNDNLLKKLSRDKIKKKTYYPYMIMKLFCYRLNKSDKLPGLLQCIHFQSSATLYQDDLLWEKICEITGIPYVKTDMSRLQYMHRGIC